MNKIMLIGRATKDFELKYTSSGVGIANGTIAVDRPTGQGKEKATDFISLVAFQKTAEACANYIRKGHRFGLEGRLQVRNYDNNEGKKVWVSEVVVERIEFLEPKDENHTSQNSGGNANQSRNDPFKDDGRPLDISDDDLPF